MRNLIILLVFAAAVFQACGPSKKSKESLSPKFKTIAPVENGYCIIFFKLDDYAIIYAGDSVLFDTRTISLDPTTDVIVDLNPYLPANATQIKVETYNGTCASCNQNKWSVAYELYKDEESLVYVAENSNDQAAAIGLSHVEIHDLTDL